MLINLFVPTLLVFILGCTSTKPTANQNKRAETEVIIANSLQLSTVPYYQDAILGQIQVSEEGEIGTFSRGGLVPIGEKMAFLKTTQSKIAQQWAQFTCSELKNLDVIYFPAGKWPKIPGESCALKNTKAFIIDNGVFTNTAIILIHWTIKNTTLVQGFPPNYQINAAVLIEIDSDLKPHRVLKAIGGIEDGPDDQYGTTELEFVTSKEIVFRFSGYVSQWQLILRKSPTNILLEEIK